MTKHVLTVFKLDEPFDEVTADGRAVTTTVVREGDRFTFSNKVIIIFIMLFLPFVWYSCFHENGSYSLHYFNAHFLLTLSTQVAEEHFSGNTRCL